LLLTLAMLLALFSAYQWGLPWAMDRIAPRIPLAWEQKLGDEALKALDRSMFRPTSLVDEQQQEVQAIFTGIAPSHSRMPLRLVFRDAPAVGANAIALPNGTIVLTDAMYYRIASAKDGLGGLLGEEMAGVLAHEIGHVQRRHSLRSIIRGSLLGTLSWTLFGDFSVVAAGLPTVLLRMEYSRGMETEADDYAANLLREHGIHPSRLADVFDLLMRTQKDPNAELPSWMRKATSYMSTHPSNDERIARLRQTPSP
jgi:Zn-dependent protease with chaperone function